MMAGTTQLGRSEDLWAQVAMVQPTSPHTVAEDQSVGGIVEGRSKRSIRPGHGWVGLNLGGPAEGAVPNCKGACCLKPYRGKTRRTAF